MPESSKWSTLNSTLFFRQFFFPIESHDIVYIESDAIVLSSTDHLFDLPNYDLYVPHCRWCNPGFVTTTLMVLRPSQHIWNRLSIWVNRNDKKVLYDMDIHMEYVITIDNNFRVASRLAVLSAL